ncbi:MAG: outer membrane beta-barrel protein [Gilvibacter sp.]|nr:outer membrane beta-barrel protein [Gilvibacter sp.]
MLPKNTVGAVGIDASNFATDVEITATGEATPLPVIKYEEKKIKKTKEFKAFERMLRREELTNYSWSVGAVIAPTTYGSLTRASMLDARLEGNTREGETNLSYGLQIKNQVNEKSALRFGLNRVNLGYNTQNFQVNIIDNVVNIYQLTGIDPGAEISDGGIPLDPSATAFFESNDVVTIDQDISYLEIPVEYQYSFINNRFGANLIGGASLMVLDDNRIFAVNDNGQSVRVGKSNNLTNLGYTLNLGLGFKYEITKHFQLNLDPMFKIQMNKPENTTVNNFRPFFFGVFSGLHFKF